MQLEAVFSQTKTPMEISKPQEASVYDFVGIQTEAEAKEMEMVIEKTCETINSDDWK